MGHLNRSKKDSGGEGDWKSEGTGHEVSEGKKITKWITGHYCDIWQRTCLLCSLS